MQQSVDMTAAHWRGRSVAATGAAGFIGSHLVERLAELGARVTAIDRAPLVFRMLEVSCREHSVPVCRDLASFDWERHLLAESPEVLFHLAGTSSVAGSIESPAEDLRRVLRHR